MEHRPPGRAGWDGEDPRSRFQPGWWAVPMLIVSVGVIAYLFTVLVIF
jgi:hypothetical protein